MANSVAARMNEYVDVLQTSYENSVGWRMNL